MGAAGPAIGDRFPATALAGGVTSP